MSDPLPSAATDGALSKKAGMLTGLSSPALLPRTGASGAPLIAVVAVMSFLAALALAGALVISGAASDWTSDLEGSITIQVKAASPEEIEAQTQTALRIVRETAGVARAEAVTRADAARLLEPWLGRGNLPDSLPIPTLIEVDLDEETPAALDLLRNRLSVAAPGAAVDDHKLWNNKLLSFATALQWTAFTVLVLVLAATAAIVIFAARAGLAANREIVDVLHLIGAEDDFIANHIQRHFFILGVRGSAIGVIGAAGLMALLFAGAQGTGGEIYFLPAGAMSIGTFAWLLVIPVLAACMTTFTARATVLKSLAERL